MAILPVEPDAQRVACPLCHTPDLALSEGALATGEFARCGRCGHLWTAGRLATVAAYSAWARARAFPARAVA